MGALVLNKQANEGVEAILPHACLVRIWNLQKSLQVKISFLLLNKVENLSVSKDKGENGWVPRGCRIDNATALEQSAYTPVAFLVEAGEVMPDEVLTLIYLLYKLKVLARLT